MCMCLRSGSPRVHSAYTCTLRFQSVYISFACNIERVATVPGSDTYLYDYSVIHNIILHNTDHTENNTVYYDTVSYCAPGELWQCGESYSI